MKDSTRARVAAAVGAAVTKRNISSVFDYSAGAHRMTSVKVTDARVTGFDHTSGTHFSGSSTSIEKLDFFDYETSAHVQLRLTDQSFTGFDYHTSSHYSGRVKGNSISIFDYQTSKHYNYSV
jgi:hypothetical protein